MLQLILKLNDRVDNLAIIIKPYPVKRMTVLDSSRWCSETNFSRCHGRLRSARNRRTLDREKSDYNRRTGETYPVVGYDGWHFLRLLIDYQIYERDLTAFLCPGPHSKAYKFSPDCLYLKNVKLALSDFFFFFDEWPTWATRSCRTSEGKKQWQINA